MIKINNRVSAQSFPAICGFTHTHFHVRPLRSRAPYKPLAGAVVKVEGVLQRQRMRLRSPVPTLFLPLPSFPLSRSLASIGPFRTPHAIMRGAHPAAFPLCPFSLMGIRRTHGRAEWCVRLSPYSLIDGCAWSPVISLSPKSHSPRPPQSSSVACPNIVYFCRERGLGFVTERE